MRTNLNQAGALFVATADVLTTLSCCCYLNWQDTRVTLPPGAEAAADNDGCFFYLAGVDDYESDPDYEAALGGRDESVATVLLAHEPIQVRRLFHFGGKGCGTSVWLAFIVD